MLQKDMRCPFCDKPAVSNHHIVPLVSGGKDEPRNIIWLCHSCHDKYEGEPLTPEMIRAERFKNLGSKGVAQEEYHWACREDGMLFMGIKLPGQERLTGPVIFFPYGAQTTFLPPQPLPKDQGAVTKLKVRSKKGRPPIVLSPDLLKGEGSLREKGARLGVSHMTIRRRLAEKPPQP